MPFASLDTKREPEATNIADNNSQLLLVYAIYRAALTLVIWALFLAGSDIGQQNTPLFLFTLATYSAINAVLLYKSAIKWTPSFWTLLLIITSDIFSIHLTAVSSGSLATGMEVLMFVAVAAGSLFLRPSHVLIVPAIATITLLLSGIAQNYFSTGHQLDFASSGWLGALFFIGSIFLSHLKQRIEVSELSALREKANAAHLQKLNQIIIERMQTGIIIAEKNGNIVLSNRAAKILLSRDVVGTTSTNHSHLSTAHRDLYDFYIHAQERAVNTNSAFTAPVEQNRIQLLVNGKSLQFTLAFINEENSLETIIFIEDLSKITQHAQQLKLSSLGKLTASIAHEIRNPLGAVSHAAQLLLELDSNEENQRLSEIIVNQTKRCSAVIESILDVSRGGTSNIEVFTLKTWLDKFLIDFNLSENGRINTVGDSNLTVRFDKAQLGQVLTNLLSNALRYSEEAKNDRSATLSIRLDSQDRPVIDIYDIGNGVSDNVRPNLFEPFMTTSSKGSGLGLYLSRELCEANQATLTYVSITNDSSAFDSRHNQQFLDGFSHCFRLQFPHPSREPISI